jgi:hypothetical protein
MDVLSTREKINKGENIICAINRIWGDEFGLNFGEPFRMIEEAREMLPDNEKAASKKAFDATDRANLIVICFTRFQLDNAKSDLNGQMENAQKEMERISIDFDTRNNMCSIGHRCLEIVKTIKRAQAALEAKKRDEAQKIQMIKNRFVALHKIIQSAHSEKKQPLELLILVAEIQFETQPTEIKIINQLLSGIEDLLNKNKEFFCVGW